MCADKPASEEARSPLYVYTLALDQTALAYDHAVAAACLQGIINRDAPRLCLLSSEHDQPRYWLDLLSTEGHWLSGREKVTLSSLDEVAALARADLRGAVIWDPNVPATLNVATTIAGVCNAVVLSPEMAEMHLDRWNLPLLEDLQGRFDGRITGSAKNDAYRWAIEAYLKPGRCSSRLLCFFEDAAQARETGIFKYVIPRDWAVMHRAFVFDLSPWGQELPRDDLGQPLGTDLRTFQQILEETLRLSAGNHMTDVSGFFPFWKYSNNENPANPGHTPATTEWEIVHLITPYNCYQNTVLEHTYNQSFHTHAPFAPLRQTRPPIKQPVENKTYICLVMGDYDSSYTLQNFLPPLWDDPNRGRIPLAWAINPNLLETFPDLITHYYRSATENDHFVCDAGAAGYLNPNRIKPEYLELFIRHNQHFFGLMDMTIAPVVQEWQELTPAVKDAFGKFSPDGCAVLILDFKTDELNPPVIRTRAHVWKSMPVTEVINDIISTADTMYQEIAKRDCERPGFYLFRSIWLSPSHMIKEIDALKREHPELEVELVDPYSFFALLESHLEQEAISAR